MTRRGDGKRLEARPTSPTACCIRTAEFSAWRLRLLHLQPINSALLEDFPNTNFCIQPQSSQTIPQMKRKRVDDTTDETEGISVKQQRVRYKLKADVAKLRHAFKVAKGFERQKLGRRSKDAAAGKGSRDEKKVEAEIAALRVSQSSRRIYGSPCQMMQCRDAWT